MMRRSIVVLLLLVVATTATAEATVVTSPPFEGPHEGLQFVVTNGSTETVFAILEFVECQNEGTVEVKAGQELAPGQTVKLNSADVRACRGRVYFDGQPDDVLTALVRVPAPRGRPAIATVTSAVSAGPAVHVCRGRDETCVGGDARCCRWWVTEQP